MRDRRTEKGLRGRGNEGRKGGDRRDVRSEKKGGREPER